MVADAGVGDRTDRANVKQEEHDASGVRDDVGLRRQRGIDGRQNQQDDPQSNEPGPGLAPAVEEDGNQGRHEGRQDHPARVDEPAEKVVQRDRPQEDEGCLLKPEPVEVARDEEGDHAEHRQHLIDHRHQRGEWHAERVIGDRQRGADRCFRQDDHQQQPLLAQRLVVVARRRYQRHQAAPQPRKRGRAILGNSQRRIHSWTPSSSRRAAQTNRADDGFHQGGCQTLSLHRARPVRRRRARLGGPECPMPRAPR